MNIREIKKLKWNGKNELIKVSENLYVETTKTKKVFKAIFKKEGKQIKATINSVDNITLTQAKQIVQKLKTRIADKSFTEAREIIRSALAKKTSKKDKEVIIKKQKESERYLLKNIIQEFLQTRNRQSQNRINNYIVRFLGDKDVRYLNEQDIIQFFKKVKNTNVNPSKTTYQRNKMATIKRLKNELSVFYTHLHFMYGINNNPLTYLTLSNIEKALGEKYQVEHFKATTNLKDIQELYKKIYELKTDIDVETNGHKTTSVYTKYALMFLMLTALRNGTLRRLKWNMINWDKKIIEIPGEITKTKKDFRLPLTNEMLKILEELKKYDNGKGLIFKGKNEDIMSENTLNAKIKKLSDGKTTAHGIRTAFATILKEKGENPLYIEEQLMHVVENKVGQAYTRTDYLEQRRKLLETWELLVITKTNQPKHITFDF